MSAELFRKVDLSADAGEQRRWRGGMLERGNAGEVERWVGGTLERINAGEEERWRGGTLKHCHLIGVVKGGGGGIAFF